MEVVFEQCLMVEWVHKNYGMVCYYYIHDYLLGIHSVQFSASRSIVFKKVVITFN